MEKTNIYFEIFDEIKVKKKCILQCWGVPGSGKSEIVRKLAQEFPFTNDNKGTTKGVVKWHIQCKDSEHDVKDELQKLTDELFKDVKNKEKKTTYESITNELQDNRCDRLFHVLQSCSFPVLIIIEDPDSIEKNLSKDLLQDFLRKLSSNDSQLLNNDTKMHLYITSRVKNPILNEDETKEKYVYVKKKITGFNQQEALQYFMDQSIEPIDESAVLQIFKRFSGLPLGLIAAKTFCNEARIDYTDYLELLKEGELRIICEEEKNIKKEFGNSAEHVFQAIALLFLPSNESDMIHWKILKCLSYFNYDRIPRFAIKYCFDQLSEVKLTKAINKVKVGRLVTNLLKHNMCSETDEGEITFHEVVSHAFRLKSHAVESKSFNPLCEAIEIMSGLISKDMRKKERSNQMYKLRRHAQTLLEHFENHREDNSVMLKALASHLYETTGAIMLRESPALFLKLSEQYFDKALDLISSNQENLKYKNQEFDPTLAYNVVKESQEKGKMLENDFTIDYASKLNMCFDKEEIQFLKSKSSSQDVFKKVEELIKSRQSKKFILVEMQKCNLFLPDSSYVEVFYAERIASILHSYSRIVLYSDMNESKEYQNKCMWMSRLSNEIAKNCKRKYDVPLLVEHLSKAGGLIPIILKVKKSSIDGNVEVLRFCKNTLSAANKTLKYYENGMLKEVYDPSINSSRINLWRYITQANTRLLKLDESEVDVEDADSCCNKLFDLSVEFWKEMSICTLCFIYCAKYYAVRRKFQESMKCFDKFFEIASDKSFNERFNVYCWAVYNYARAIDIPVADDSLQDVVQEHDDRFKDAKNKRDEVLNSEKIMSKDLKKKLKSVLNGDLC